MPWFGENNARFGDNVAVLGGARLPVVGSVGRTSGGFSTELEQPAVTMTARAVAAISLFMSSLLGILFGESVRSHSPAVQNDAPNLSYWGGSVRLGPKRWQ